MASFAASAWLRRLRFLAGAVAILAGARGDGVPATAAFIYADGFQEAVALALAADGSLLVTDRRAGTLTRLGPGRREIVLEHLDRPGPVIVDDEGVIHLVESDTRVLRLDSAGVLSVLADVSSRIGAMTLGLDGRPWIVVRDDTASESHLVRLEPSGASTQLAAVTGFRMASALSVESRAAYVGMRALPGTVGQDRTTVARLPVGADGRLGPAEALFTRDVLWAPQVAADADGSLYVTGVPPDGTRRRVLAKRQSSGAVHVLAADLENPGALALAPDGNLYVVEAGTRIRMLRAPAPPRLDLPAFTNQDMLRVEGFAEPDALVQVFDALGAVRPSAAAIADPAGRFAAVLPVVADAENRWWFVATSARGAGLRSAAAAAGTVHDGRPPAITILHPHAAAHVRQAVVVRAAADDESSGVEIVEVLLGDLSVATVRNPVPGAPFTASVTVEAPDGAHALTVAAVDRAGNTASAAQLLVIDTTPPDTLILSGPAGEVADRSIRFTFGGTDALSAAFEFSWRLDDGEWSPFSVEEAVELSMLDTGPHRFEVRARDAAGNMDPTPAAQGFTVSGLRLQVIEPAPGAVLGSGSVWVRGSVDGAAAVAIVLPADLQAAFSTDTLPIAVEAGTFAAEVWVLEDTTALTVIARAAGGESVQEVVPIVVQASVSSPGRLTAVPDAGIAPHAVRFPIGGFPAGSAYSLDLESDGIVDFAGSDLREQEFVYARPGIYVATLGVLSPGGPRTFRAIVEVYDGAALEADLQGAWVGFRGALRRGDLVTAVSFVHSRRRARWHDYLAQLTPEQLAITDAVFTDLAPLVVVRPPTIEGEMLREESGLTYSYPITFQRDVDGAWRLWQF